MRSAALIAIACTIACGSTRQSDLVEAAPQPPATVFAAGDGVDVRLSASGRTIEDVVFAPAVEAWPALLLAFETLEIPIAYCPASGGDEQQSCFLPIEGRAGENHHPAARRAYGRMIYGERTS
jgi:hypothetical protein